MEFKPKMLIIDPETSGLNELVNSLTSKFEVYLSFINDKYTDYINRFQIHIVLIHVSEESVTDTVNAIRSIRSSSLYDDLPILVYMKEVDKNVISKCIAEGVQDYVIRNADLDLFTHKAYNLVSFYHSIKFKVSGRFDYQRLLMSRKNIFAEFDKEVERIVLNDLNYSIKDIACRLNTSVATLERIVKKSTGHTPNKYIVKKKLERAEVLLGTRKFNIKEIAFMVGFSSASHFTRTYKQYFGITPTGRDIAFLWMFYFNPFNFI